MGFAMAFLSPYLQNGASAGEGEAKDLANRGRVQPLLADGPLPDLKPSTLVVPRSPCTRAQARQSVQVSRKRGHILRYEGRVAPPHPGDGAGETAEGGQVFIGRRSHHVVYWVAAPGGLTRDREGHLRRGHGIALGLGQSTAATLLDCGQHLIQYRRDEPDLGALDLQTKGTQTRKEVIRHVNGPRCFGGYANARLDDLLKLVLIELT